MQTESKSRLVDAPIPHIATNIEGLSAPSSPIIQASPIKSIASKPTPESKVTIPLTAIPNITNLQRDGNIFVQTIEIFIGY
jgi:hypothetical protein